MLKLFNYYISSILIILILTNTSVCLITCESYEIRCKSYRNYWCCASGRHCGDTYGSCESYVSNENYFIRMILAFFVILCWVIYCLSPIKHCISCGQRQSQTVHTVVRTVSTQQSEPTHLQQSYQRVPLLPPIYSAINVNTVTSDQDVDVEPLPSYEVAIKNLQRENHSAGTCNGTDSRV